MNEQPRVFTVREAAVELRLSEAYVYDLVARGDLPTIKNVGRRKLISRKALEAFIDGEQGSAA